MTHEGAALERESDLAAREIAARQAAEEAERLQAIHAMAQEIVHRLSECVEPITFYELQEAPKKILRAQREIEVVIHKGWIADLKISPPVPMSGFTGVSYSHESHSGNVLCTDGTIRWMHDLHPDPPGGNRYRVFRPLMEVNRTHVNWLDELERILARLAIDHGLEL